MKDNLGRTLDYLRLSVVDRCNLKCVYCMPSGGAGFDPWQGLMSYDEMIRAVDLFAELGITKVRITGGEPLVRNDLEELIFRIKEIPGIRELALSTNAVLLEKRAENLKWAGIDRVNISLDTLDRAKFERISKMDRLHDVLAGIDAAVQAGMKPLKINTVLMKGINEEDILPLVSFAVERSIEVRFIELMPTAANVAINPYDEYFSNENARKIISGKYLLLPEDSYLSSPARVFSVAGTGARVGFISPLSCQFCSRCNRLRLKANGALKTCLHGDEDLNIRELMQSGCSRETLLSKISGVVFNRPEEHYLNDTRIIHKDFQMSHIGG